MLNIDYQSTLSMIIDNTLRSSYSLKTVIKTTVKEWLTVKSFRKMRLILNQAPLSIMICNIEYFKNAMFCCTFLVLILVVARFSFE